MVHIKRLNEMFGNIRKYLSDDSDWFFGGEEGANRWMDAEMRRKKNARLFDLNWNVLKGVTDDDMAVMCGSDISAARWKVAKCIRLGIAFEDLLADVRFCRGLNKKEALAVESRLRDMFEE